MPSNRVRVKRVSGFTVMLATLVALLVVFVTILGLFLLPTHSSTTRRLTFSLPTELPTASINASNPAGCGANRSDFLSFPARSNLYYYVTVNESEARVNYWVLRVNATPVTSTVSYGNESRGNLVVGDAGATIQFMFQGCGSTPTVPLGFWGNFTLSSSG